MVYQFNRTVLIVDDNESSRLTLQDLLEHDGYMAMGAPDGFIATKIVRQETIDLVFLDVNMPGKDGIEVLREIKIINELLPVVMITAMPSTDVYQWALEEGALTLLPKPVDVKQIRHILRQTFFGFQL